MKAALEKEVLLGHTVLTLVRLMVKDIKLKKEDIRQKSTLIRLLTTRYTK